MVGKDKENELHLESSNYINESKNDDVLANDGTFDRLDE
jgi:hypothetical protein